VSFVTVCFADGALYDTSKSVYSVLAVLWASEVRSPRELFWD